MNRRVRGSIMMEMKWLTALTAMLLLAGLTDAQDRRRRRGPDRAPKKGAEAPDFELKTLGDPDTEVKLSDYKGKSPVVLIFGSYT